MSANVRINVLCKRNPVARIRHKGDERSRFRESPDCGRIELERNSGTDLYNRE